MFGRPLYCSWWFAALTFGFGYASAFTGAAMAVKLSVAGTSPFVEWLKGRPPTSLFVIPWIACIGGLELLGFCWLNRSFRSKWRARVSGGTIPPWFLASVSIASGAIAGAGYGGLTLLPWSIVRTCGSAIVALSGRLWGLWFVHRRQQRPVDSDYDDRMTGLDQEPTGRTKVALFDLAATEALGRRLGELLFPNAVVALIGPLGAGKTHLTRAVAEGLGIANPAAVTSPTFTLIHEYPARLPIFHFDAHRLNGPNAFLDLGVTEDYEAGGVCLLEWAGKVEAALPAERLTIRLVPVDENRRRAEVVGVGGRYEALAASVGHDSDPVQR